MTEKFRVRYARADFFSKPAPVSYLVWATRACHEDGVDVTQLFLQPKHSRLNARVMLVSLVLLGQ